jgi:sugar phosphate permease
MAAMTFVTGLLVWFLVRNKPQDFGLPPVERALTIAGRPAERIAIGKAFPMIFGNLDFWLLATWFFFNGAILFSFAGSGPGLTSCWFTA